MGGAALQRCVNCRLSEMRFSAKGIMTIAYRGTTGDGTYFVISSTSQKKALLQSERTAKLFIETLLEYRIQRKYLLHEFVIMPDHLHLLITPVVTLEKALQLIKGGFHSVLESYFRFEEIFGRKASMIGGSEMRRNMRLLKDISNGTQ
jgi:REP element-mobilizing transposase RayT